MPGLLAFACGQDSLQTQRAGQVAAPRRRQGETFPGRVWGSCRL